MNRECRKEVNTHLKAMIGMLLLSLCALSLNAQKVTVKTNFIHWGTLSPNLGVETAIGKKNTLEIPVSYNAWTFADNKKWKHFLIQPEFRWWQCEAFNGSFIGLHAHYARYNVGNVNLGNFKLPIGINVGDLNNYRYDGWLAGAGFTFGYQLYLASRWNLEFAIGAGYSYMDHTKYDCPKCGELIGDEQKHYIGPTKAAISLVFFIK